MPRSPVTDVLRRTPVLAFAAGAGLLLAGCGSSGSSATPAAAPSSSAAAPASAPTTATSVSASSSASAGTTVTATETDFKIALSQQTFSPGSYTFKATNSGKVPHALTIVGPGVSSMSTSNLSPGQSANLTVTLQSGSYEIYCPVDSHKSLGMDLHITVG